ncbi:MAG: FkbM family methyltransferase [Dehalococcoidia bacterium]|nr:FkbM family methyltransferase [Dehalococcoidia bacterium]
MGDRPRLAGTLRYLAAWLNPSQPVFRIRAAESGLIFFAHRRDAIGRHIAKYGAHEPELTRWIRHHLAVSPPGLFVDAGANIGWHTLHAARQPNVEAVVAFEPDSFNAWLLDRNRTINGAEKVIIVAAALGARRGTIRLHRYKTSNLMRHSVVTDHGHGSAIVPLVDLDGALADLELAERSVSLLKIDVEGYEPEVLAGASRTLRRTRALVTECSPALSRSGRLSVSDMARILDQAGFAPFLLDSRGRLETVELVALLASHEQRDIIWLRREERRQPTDGERWRKERDRRDGRQACGRLSSAPRAP